MSVKAASHGHLSEKLLSARRKFFVGRKEELTLLRKALTPGGPSLVYWHGPGGVGKSTLLREFQAQCETRKMPVYRVDGMYMEPSEEGFLAALEKCLAARGCTDAQPPPHPPRSAADLGRALKPGAKGRAVLIVDTFEHLQILEDWLRDDFLPLLEEGLCVVMAGQRPLSAAWRTDLGWQSLIRCEELGNLNEQESLAYLTLRGVPAQVREQAWALCLGHPLALSLLADLLLQTPDADLPKSWALSIVPTLLSRFLETAPSPLQRRALYAAARVYTLDEPMLSTLLGVEDASETFDWLTGLSFMEVKPTGICPHDIAREVLLQDLRRRNPDQLVELTEMAKRHLTLMLPSAGGTKYRQLMFNNGFLYLDHPTLWRAYRQYNRRYPTGSLLNALENFHETPMTPREWPGFEKGLRTIEGEPAAALAKQWWILQPDAFRMLRHPGEGVKGYFCVLRLTGEEGRLLEDDPAVSAVWQWLQKHAPLRKGEYAQLFRWWFCPKDAHGFSPVAVAIHMQVFLGVTLEPQPAVSFAVTPTNPDWEALFTLGQFRRLGRFEFGARRPGFFGHDWRRHPTASWFPLLGIARPTPDLTLLPRHANLNKAAFYDAVKAALPLTLDLVGLAANPLINSRMVLSQTGGRAPVEERAEVLQVLLRQSVRPGKGKTRSLAQRAMAETFLRPYRPQAQVAKALEMSVSVYKRHMKVGMETVCGRLWQLEQEEMSKDSGLG